jgi:hypothetical protein
MSGSSIDQVGLIDKKTAGQQCRQQRFMVQSTRGLLPRSLPRGTSLAVFSARPSIIFTPVEQTRPDINNLLDNVI